jgi:hypothetical protein
VNGLNEWVSGVHGLEEGVCMGWRKGCVMCVCVCEREREREASDS